MVRYHDEDEREKISWREIDKRKDRSRYAPKERSEDRPRPKQSEWRMRHYRKQVDRLFTGKKGTKKHMKAHEDIDRYHGTDQFEEAARTYVEQYGLPDDWHTLSLLLDYSDPATVTETLKAMKDLYKTRNSTEQLGFKAKVDILAMTASNSDLRDCAEEILKSL